MAVVLIFGAATICWLLGIRLVVDVDVVRDLRSIRRLVSDVDVISGLCIWTIIALLASLAFACLYAISPQRGTLRTALRAIIYASNKRNVNHVPWGLPVVALACFDVYAPLEYSTGPFRFLRQGLPVPGSRSSRMATGMVAAGVVQIAQLAIPYLGDVAPIIMQALQAAGIHMGSSLQLAYTRLMQALAAAAAAICKPFATAPTEQNPQRSRTTLSATHITHPPTHTTIRGARASSGVSLPSCKPPKPAPPTSPDVQPPPSRHPAAIISNRSSSPPTPQPTHSRTAPGIQPKKPRKPRPGPTGLSRFVPLHPPPTATTNLSPPTSISPHPHATPCPPSAPSPPSPPPPSVGWTRMLNPWRPHPSPPPAPGPALHPSPSSPTLQPPSQQSLIAPPTTDPPKSVGRPGTPCPYLEGQEPDLPIAFKAKTQQSPLRLPVIIEPATPLISTEPLQPTLHKNRPHQPGPKNPHTPVHHTRAPPSPTAPCASSHPTQPSRTHSSSSAPPTQPPSKSPPLPSASQLPTTPSPESLSLATALTPPSSSAPPPTRSNCLAPRAAHPTAFPSSPYTAFAAAADAAAATTAAAAASSSATVGLADAPPTAPPTASLSHTKLANNSHPLQPTSASSPPTSPEQAATIHTIPTNRHARTLRAAAAPFRPSATAAPAHPAQDAETGCIVCMSAAASAGFLHGVSLHLCICLGCMGLFSAGGECPICRAPIERVVEVFQCQGAWV